MISVGVVSYASLEEIQRALKARSLSCEELVQAYLSNIADNSVLNAFVDVYAEEAVKRAQNIDQRLREGSDKLLGPLFGAILSLKDVIAHQGHGLTAGSLMLHGYESVYSATAVERLIEADAIIIGRVNCDEFAMGSDNRTSHYGPVKNGIDPEYVPGGSSGGSAVSVQINGCLASIGSDTGGSVRQPASFCGLTGFKPSYGRISRHGLIAYGSSFDQIGIIGRDLNDIHRIYSVMKGPDAHDATLVEHTEPLDTTRSGKLAYVREALEHPSLQPAIKDAFFAKLSRIESLGIEVEPVSFDLIDYLIPAYYVLTSAEASSNLSRYDGLRYGYRASDAASLDETYTKTRTEGFGLEVKRRILLGTFVLSVGYYDAYFAKAQKVRRLICDQMNDWMQKYDGMLLPTTPGTAWKLGDHKKPVEIYLADVFSVLANLAGAPAISIPLGVDVENLPFGIQMISGTFQEDKLFVYSDMIQQGGLDGSNKW
ncbi:MAG: Asp-tRNA(Asn)/Glu-tRNA(Gln) amidotransferase subunit GatA [Saprospiraceae bacterium]|nr:Asp-tRNA(Asn)/Glu-tRNA(Gln) amidotransferase subunit GatA [Saprospiraceae bacterium]